MVGSRIMGGNAGGVIRSRFSCIFMSIIFLFCFCCILGSCGDQEKAGGETPALAVPAKRSGGIYHAPLLNNPKGLDPARAEDQYSVAVVHQMFDGLVKFSPDLLIVPALADNWKIEQSGLVYHFFLRKDARFHNRKPVTSQDVIFSFSRLIRTDPAPSVLPHMLKIAGAHEYRNGQADQVVGIQAISDLEFLIRLEEPYAPFLAALGMYQTSIVPEAEVSQPNYDFARNPVGSGAFCFVSWDDNKSIRLKRFPEYYLGPSFLDEIEYVIYPGGQIEEVLADFKSGKLEDMPVYGSIRKQLLSQKNIKWVHRSSLSLLFYGMNCEHPMLRNPAVRRALSMAIDREKLVSNVYDGQFEPARSVLPPGILGYNPEKLKIEDDISRAQGEISKVLREGFGDNPTLEVVSAVQSPIAKAEIDFIARCWTQLGITLKAKFIPDWAEFEHYVKSPSMQIYRYVWFMDIPDPDNLLQVLFGSDSDVNYMRYRNPEVDGMLRSARIIFEPMDRAEIYERIEDLVVRTTSIIPLVHLSIDLVYQSNVQGIQLNSLGAHNMSLHQVWLSFWEQKEK